MFQLVTFGGVITQAPYVTDICSNVTTLFFPRTRTWTVLDALVSPPASCFASMAAIGTKVMARSLCTLPFVVCFVNVIPCRVDRPS